MPELVIDLGDQWEQSDEPKTPQWTVARLRRIAALLVVLTLPVASLARASPLPKPVFTLVLRFQDFGGNPWVQPEAGLLIKRERDRMVVLEPDGRERWRLNQNGRFHTLQVLDGLLVARGEGDRIEAFDLQTGQSRWRLRGWNLDFAGDLIVLTTDLKIEVYAKDGPRLLWSTEALFDWHHLDRQRQTVLIIRPGGVLAEHALATGKELRSAELGIALGTEHAFIGVNWDSITLGRIESDLMAETFLDRGTLQPIPDDLVRWSATRDCGRVICANERRDGMTSILDKETGAVLWNIQPWHTVASVAGGLLILSRPNGFPQQWRVLDLVDRQQQSLASLWGWTALVDNPHSVETRPLKVEPILLKSGGGRTQVALLTPTGVRLLGELPRELNNCDYEEHLLVCKTADHSTEVWRIDF